MFIIMYCPGEKRSWDLVLFNCILFVRIGPRVCLYVVTVTDQRPYSKTVLKDSKTVLHRRDAVLKDIPPQKRQDYCIQVNATDWLLIGLLHRLLDRIRLKGLIFLIISFFLFIVLYWLTEVVKTYLRVTWNYINLFLSLFESNTRFTFLCLRTNPILFHHLKNYNNKAW